MLLQFGSILTDDAMFKVRGLCDPCNLPLIIKIVANKGRVPVLGRTLESMGVSAGVPPIYHHLTRFVTADGLYEAYLDGCAPVVNGT